MALTRKFSLASSLRLFTSHTSIHGVRYTNDLHTHRVIRIFWLIVFVLSIAVLTFYARGAYVKWKIAPDISMSEQLKPIREIPFPAVTICSPASVKSEFANYRDAFAHRNGSSSSHFDELPIEQQANVAAMLQACDPSLSTAFATRIRHAAGEGIVSRLSRSSLATNEALSLCILINEQRQDCAELMTRVVTDAGICFAYNMQGYHSIFNGRAMSSDFDLYKRSGVRNVLVDGSHAFDDEHDEELQWSLGNGYVRHDDENAFPYRIVSDSSVEFVLRLSRNESSNFCPRLRNSYKVIFHVPNEMPTKFHDYIYVSTGMQFFISMEAKFHSHDASLRSYSPVMRRCYFDGERKLRFFSAYTKAHCDLECLTNFTLRACGCVKFSMPRSSETKVCDLVDARCYSAALRNWPHNDAMSMGLAMPCSCFPPCVNIKYKTDLVDHIDIDDAFNEDVTARRAMSK
jgi:amiloride-sensitive sodium channel